MRSVNVLIGGTGVSAAWQLKHRSAFYSAAVGGIVALDVDPGQEAIAVHVLGTDLVLPLADFDARMQAAAAGERAVGWETMWNGTRPFSQCVVRTGAETVTKYLKGDGGLYTLRSTGWLAFRDIWRNNPGLVDRIAELVKRAAAESDEGSPAVLTVVASIAGGTGSGLLLPLIAAVRATLDSLQPPPAYQIHVVLVAPSAFANDWEGDVDHWIKKTRGETGAFACYRELTTLSASRSADPHLRPEPRSVVGWAYPFPIDRMYWIGRRKRDAQALARDTFYETTRVLALLNDDALAGLVAGRVGNFSDRIMPSFATIEYPKLEYARRLALRIGRDLVAEIKTGVPAAQPSRGGTDDILKTGMPGALPSTNNTDDPLLKFINAGRTELGYLKDATAAQRNISQALIVGPSSLLADLQLPNGIGFEPRGAAITKSAYYGDDAAHRQYCDVLFGNLARRASSDYEQSKKDARGELLAAKNALVRVASEAIRTATTERGAPSLAGARSALRELADSIRCASILFAKDVTERVNPDERRALVTAKAALEEVENAKKNLLNAQARPPSRLYTLLIRLFGVVAALSAGSYAATQVSVTSLLGLLFGTPRQQSDLISLALAFLALAAAGVTEFARQRAVVPVSDVRRNAEEALVESWQWALRCQQAHIVWETARAFCSESIGETTPGAIASRESLLGPALALLDRAEGWLTDLEGELVRRETTAAVLPPQVIRAVGDETHPADAIISRLWPEVEIRPDVMKQISAYLFRDLRISCAEGSPELEVREWVPEASRDYGQQRRLDAKGTAFLASLEAEIARRVQEQGLLIPTLQQVMDADPDLSDPYHLASALDDLARAGATRGPAGELTPAPRDAVNYLCVPDSEVEVRVNEALRIATEDPHLYPELARLASSLPQGRCLQTRAAGEAIALLQLWRFGLPGSDEPQFTDLEEAAATYFGLGHDAADATHFSVRTTEFHLLPELSSAARMEGATGRSRPLHAAVTQRLYGSHPIVETHPSVLDLFYLARVRGYLGGVLDPPDQALYPAGPMQRWRLHASPVARPNGHADGLGGTGATDPGASADASVVVPQQRGAAAERAAFELIRWPQIHEPVADALFRSAREIITVFDVFVAALGYHGGALSDAHVPAFPGLPPIVDTTIWPQHAAELDAARRALVEEWWRLKTDPALRQRTYELMRGLVAQDARSMSDAVSRDWVLACDQSFRASEGHLGTEAGLLVGPPSRPDGQRVGEQQFVSP